MRKSFLKDFFYRIINVLLSWMMKYNFLTKFYIEGTIKANGIKHVKTIYPVIGGIQ